MILKYGGSNFYCFKEDFEIDLRLNKNCPEEVSCGKDVASVMCVKGANGAGKTNALKALSFIASFISASFDKKPDAGISIESHFNNSLPIKLFCEFRLEGADYRYDLVIENNAVIKEGLVLQSENNRQLFIREINAITECSSEFSELNSIPQIRSNASLICIANQHEIKCISQIYQQFNFIRSNVNYRGYSEHWTEDGISEFYHSYSDALKFVIAQLTKFDTGIIDIKIDSYENSKGEKIYFPWFYYNVNGKPEKLRISQQSSGTRRLYKLLAFFSVYKDFIKDQVSSSFILVFDELDLHLHSFIVPELIKQFENSDNTQLIFTCQNDNVLDQMGKYRTSLINKEDNESYSYRLDELPSDLLRNNRPITPHYKKGSIGGVPNIGEDEVSDTGDAEVQNIGE